MSAEQRLSMVTPIGTLLLRATGERLAGIEIVTDAANPALAKLSEPPPVEVGASSVLWQALLELDQYFTGRRQKFHLPLDLRRWRLIRCRSSSPATGLSPPAGNSAVTPVVKDCRPSLGCWNSNGATASGHEPVCPRIPLDSRHAHLLSKGPHFG
jgi:hypothetical protein